MVLLAPPERGGKSFFWGPDFLGIVVPSTPLDISTPLNFWAFFIYVVFDGLDVKESPPARATPINCIESARFLAPDKIEVTAPHSTLIAVKLKSTRSNANHNSKTRLKINF